MAVAFAAILFLSAGTMAWWAGWMFLILFFAFVIALSAWLRRFDPDLLEERLSGIGKADQKAWDKIVLAIVAVGFVAWLVLMGLDAVRYRWSQVPIGVQLAGALILLCSDYIFYLTFRENTYLSPAVRVQAERAHTVVCTGLYAYVRHPMYAGFAMFAFGTPLLLGSWYGVLGGFVLIVLVAWRAVLEERTLRDELPGYREYMGHVRYRFVPHVW